MRTLRERRTRVGYGACVLELRPFVAADDRWLISWVRSPDELLTFAGPSLKWPLNRTQLDAIRLRTDTIAWTAVTPPATAPVGHIQLVLTDDPARGLLGRVIIAPAHRGQGLGRQLVEAALDAAVARGLRVVELKVRAYNEAAIRTYSNLGFRKIDNERGDSAGVLRMQLELQ